MKDKSRRLKLRIWKQSNRLISYLYDKSVNTTGNWSTSDHFALIRFDQKIRDAMHELDEDWRNKSIGRSNQKKE